jgi:hypothetical protein
MASFWPINQNLPCGNTRVSPQLPLEKSMLICHNCQKEVPSPFSHLTLHPSCSLPFPRANAILPGLHYISFFNGSYFTHLSRSAHFYHPLLNSIHLSQAMLTFLTPISLGNF